MLSTRVAVSARSDHSNGEIYDELGQGEKTILHLLPEGLVRIRNFGFLANRRRTTLLPLCFQLLGAAQQPQVDQDAPISNHLWHCPKCGGSMVVVERLTAAKIQLRSPPPIGTVA